MFVAPLCPGAVRDWIQRRLSTAPTMILDEEHLQEIVTSADNPTATGTFRRMLLQTSTQAIVFASENLVDSDTGIYVGRREDMLRLVNNEKSFAVYGGRRIGKTSLLNAVGKELKARGCRTAYCSVEGELSKANGGLNICNDLLQKLGIGHRCSSFSEFKARILEYLASEPSVKVVIILDELDRYIVARETEHAPHDLIHTLRTLYQETGGRCRFILAGFIELWKQLTVQGGIPGGETPWFNFLEQNGPLTGLGDSDAQAIIRQGFQEILGIRFATPSIPRLITEKTTTHPAFVQKFCDRLHARLHQNKSDCITPADVEAVFSDRSDDNFVGFVNLTLRENLKPWPRLIVYLLAAEGLPSFSAGDVRRTLAAYDVPHARITDQVLRGYLDELKITSVIRTDQQSFGSYRFSVPSYPLILKEFERLNRDAIFDLIKEAGL